MWSKSTLEPSGELTVPSHPRANTAGNETNTGVDALTHAVEVYVSRKATPFSDGLALNAVRTLGRHLRRVYADGGESEAREAMMLAAPQAGIALSNAGVALRHCMSRPIGAHFHVAHGLSNAMLFPAVTAFSVPAAESRYADCARALGVADDGDGDALAAGRFVEARGSISCNALDRVCGVRDRVCGCPLSALPHCRTGCSCRVARRGSR